MAENIIKENASITESEKAMSPGFNKRFTNHEEPFQQTPGQYYNNRRLLQQARGLLDNAWLMFQEMNIVTDPVETNTLKQLSILFKNNNMSDMQKKMNIIRSKWLESDFDASLSLQAMKIYNTVIKMGKDFPEQKTLTQKINQRLWHKQNNPGMNSATIPNEFFDEDPNSAMDTTT